MVVKTFCAVNSSPDNSSDDKEMKLVMMLYEE